MLERAKGIEPSYAAWEAAVLPLNYARAGRTIASRQALASDRHATLPMLRYTSADSFIGATAVLKSLIADPRVERAILILIVINAVILGLETYPSVVAAFGGILFWLDHAILAVFVFEILARMAVQRTAFFRDAWNIFDFLVVAIALIPATGPLQVLRALRILRVLRLITAVPSLKRVVGGLIGALPGMGSVSALLLLIFYVFAVMATKLFGEDFPNYFGTLAASIFSLFQIMTLEAWADSIVRPVMEKYPYAWLFFIPYIVVTSFAVLNLFIGIVVSAMQSEHEAEQAETRKAENAAQAALLDEMRALRSEVASLRRELNVRK
jgi:voltage-gated sodium channel